MANGLFLNPQQIFQAQQAGPMSRSQMQDVLRGSAFNLGGAGGGALTRLFGGDSRSAEEKRAAAIQEALKGLSFGDISTVAPTMDALKGGGNTQEALALAGLLPKASTKAKPVGEPFQQTIQDPANPNNWVKQWMQNYNDGSVKSIGTALQNETEGASSLPDGVYGEMKISDVDAKNIIGRLSKLPEFSSSFGDRDIEELEPLVGEIMATANQIKQQTLQHILNNNPNADLSSDKMMAAFGPVANQRWLRQGFKQWIAGGGLDASVDEQAIGAGKVTPRGDIDTTDPTTLKENAEFNVAKIEAAEAIGLDKQGRIKGLLTGGPKGFRLAKMNQKQASQSFANIDLLNNDQLMQVLSNQGFNFQNGAVRQSHMKAWNIMRENSGLVKSYISALEFPTQAKSYKARVIKQLTVGKNPQGLATASFIFDYLNRVGPNPRNKPTDNAPVDQAVPNPLIDIGA